MKKKIVSLILVLAMSTSMLACGSSKSSSDSSTDAAGTETGSDSASYDEQSSAIYDDQLGDFYDTYQTAQEADTVSE